MCWDSLLAEREHAQGSSSPRDKSAPGIAPWHKPRHGGSCEPLQPPLPLGPSTASLLASQRLVTLQQVPLLRAQLGPGTPERFPWSRAESRGTGLAPTEQRIPRSPGSTPQGKHSKPGSRLLRTARGAHTWPHGEQSARASSPSATQTWCQGLQDSGLCWGSTSKEKGEGCPGA